MLRFAHPYYLYLLVIIPIFIGIYILMVHKKNIAKQKYGEPALLRKLMPEYSSARSVWKFVLLMLSLTFMIIAIADPQTGTKLEKIKRRGIDLVFVLDVSNSMLAQDITPNRLERAKQAIERLLEDLDNDRVGLVVFAGQAYIQMPITTDYSATKLFLSTINPGMIPVQGTAIGAAINKAVECFGESKQSKAIMLITDGENHEDDAVAAAHNAASKGIRVFAIGMGDPSGAPIPAMNGDIQIGYKKDNSGNTIITKLDEELLREIAQAGNGIYVRANNVEVGVQSIFNQLNKLEKVEYNARIFSDYEDRFQFFIFISLLLILVDLLLFERKGRLAGKIKLFE